MSFWKKLEHPIMVLAPMADVTDVAFRRIIAKYGKPDVMWTEFVSADGLALAPEEGRKKLLKNLEYDESERPIVAQFFGMMAGICLDWWYLRTPSSLRLYYHLKTKEHKKQERKDAKIVFQSLPISLQKIAKESWQDYTKQKTPEAKFVYALDKIEPLFELFNPINELSLKRLKHSYDVHYQRKFIATENFPVMRRFTDVISKDMLARKIFWEND
jgi:hypothetical protein